MANAFHFLGLPCRAWLMVLPVVLGLGGIGLFGQVGPPLGPASQVPSGPMFAPPGSIPGPPGAGSPPAGPGAPVPPPGNWAPPSGPAMPTPSPDTVVDVQIVGNRAIAREKITPYVRTRAGRPFDPQIVEEDVRRLTRSKLFVSVRPSYKHVPGGRIVTFEVVERNTIREIKYVGNEQVRKKVLAKETGLKEGDALDPFSIEEARKKIEDYYQRKGFSNARVSAIEGDRPNDTRVVFLINEGVKQRILWVRFIGNTIASDQRLLTQVRSKPPLLYLFKGEVDRKQIDEDMERLTAYYRALGFFRARIGRELEFNEDHSWLVLTFVIDEGPRYHVRNVSFIGNTKIATENLEADLKLKAKEPFNQAKLQGDVAKIREKYGSVGYVFANVEAENRFLEEPGVLDLVYHLEEGDRYRVGRINVQIKGENPHTRLTAVLNQIPIRPGEIIDIRKVRDGEKKLRSSQLFAVDPMSGNVPRIVLTPPEAEEGEKAIARKPKPGSNYRGQSPDPPDREIDVTIYGEIQQKGEGGRGKAEEGRAPPPDIPQPVARANWFARPATPGVATAGVASMPANTGRMPAPPQPAQPWVVRAQYTTEVAPSAQGSRSWLPWQGAPRAPAAIGYPPANAGPADTGAGGFSPNLAPQPVNSDAGLVGPTPPPGGAPPAGTVPCPTPPPPGPPPAGLFPPPPSGLYDPLRPTELDPNDRFFPRPLDIGVLTQETQTGRLMLGVGVNSDAGLVGQILLDEQNFDITRFPRSWEDVRNATAFRGAGQRFRIEAVPGTQVQRYMVNFQEPYLLNTEISLGLSGFFYDRLFREWNEQRLGGRVALGYHFTHRLSGSVSYRGEKVNVRDPIYPPGILPELDEVVGDNFLHGFGVQLAHDTRDTPFLATEGHLIEVSLEQVIGSFSYPRVDLDLRKYFLLSERPDGSGRHVINVTSRMGVTGADTPIYDHYYAGGFSTMRGFSFRGVSPEKAGVLVGGHFMLLASVEYMFPITADDMLRAVVFCDTGTVQDSINNWRDRYRVAPGFGARITIPAMGPAPLAFDFAFPVASESFDRREVFSFFLGVLR